MRTETIEYQEGGVAFEGHAAYDESSRSKRPCVLVSHAWAGLLGAEREAAGRLAGLGYLAFAVDLFGRGVRGNPAGDNSKLMQPLLEDRAMLRRRLLASLEAARKHPLADPGRVAAIGYCFGGLCVLDLARSGAPGVRGVASFHGLFHPPKLGPQPPIAAKVLLLHGWDDPLAPPEDVLMIARELTEARADWQLHAYGHALHAFTNPHANNPAGGVKYDAGADRRSWAAMEYFLKEAVG
ncbi:MAG: dienelactone hydrolase family protein [Candidatus Tectomicrobia bacterium]|uniref:Dienelactone hydrolase family protein n=1 Tax=Tectimicrobiota bacterium TaxID=2528274 RepID=A0A932I0U0_UNCTE|nr:dienelactone hydrolase family protein [Candidatus Tectomicrobia bacterium]